MNVKRYRDAVKSNVNNIERIYNRSSADSSANNNVKNEL